MDPRTTTANPLAQAVAVSEKVEVEDASPAVVHSKAKSKRRLSRHHLSPFRAVQLAQKHVGQVQHGVQKHVGKMQHGVDVAATSLAEEAARRSLDLARTSTKALGINLDK